MPLRYPVPMLLRGKVELALIPVAAVAVLLSAPLLPAALPLGTLALLAAALLLGQGLLRDLWLKYGADGAIAPAGNSRSFCVESGLGLLGIAAGGLLLAAGLGGTFALPPWRWAALVAATGSIGFALKDLVIDLRARRFRIEKDHRSVVLW